MATNITSLQPQLDPTGSIITSVTLIGLTDRATRLRISISSPVNNAVSISGIVVIDSTQATDANNQRSWSKSFVLNTDYYPGDLSCGDLLDLNIEWFDNSNGFTQEGNFPTQLSIDCNAAPACSISINTVVTGVRQFANNPRDLSSINARGSSNLCSSVIVSITDDNQATYRKTVNVINNSWSVKFERNDGSGYNGKYFSCGNSYLITAECVNNNACNSTATVQVNCINPCPQSSASVVLTAVSDNTQISNPSILHCAPAGAYTIAVTDPPDTEVATYEWYTGGNLIANENGRVVPISVGAQESTHYQVIVRTVDGCIRIGDVIFSCDGGVQDCILSDWSPWSDCINNTQTRQRSIITPAANGGKPCPPTTELMETRRCTGNSTPTPPPIDNDNTTTPPQTVCDLCCWWLIVNIMLTIAALITIIIAGCVFQWVEPISATSAIVLGIGALVSWILWAIFCLALNPLRMSLCQPLAIVIEILDWAELVAGTITIVIALLGQLPCAFAFAIDWALVAIIRRILKGFAQFIGCSLNPFQNQ